MEAETTARRIVIGYDGSENADDALALGRVLAEVLAATPVVAGVAPVLDHLISDEELQRATEEIESDLLAAGRRRLEGLEPETRAVADDSPARGLHDLAEAERPLLIVLGSSHRGPVGRVLLGSVGQSLLAGAPCALAVAPRGLAAQGEVRLLRIGVGIDGSAESNVALMTAIALAQRVHARLLLLAAVEPPKYGYSATFAALSGEEIRDADEKAKADALEQATRTVPHDMPVERRLLHGDPAHSLAEAATDVDLLVIGSRGYGPIRRVLLGGMAARLMRSAPCPVLVLPRGAGDDPLRLARASGAG